MSAEPLFETTVSKMLLRLLKLMIFLNVTLVIILEIFWYLSDFDYHYYHQIPYFLIYEIFKAIYILCMESGLLYTYLKGLKNIAYDWYKKRAWEYEQCGETQRGHQILICVTRCTVICVISCVTTLVYVLWKSVWLYIIHTYAASNVYAIGYCINEVMIIMDIITYTLCIYFIYDFGYEDYLKLCNCCHVRMYSYCKQRHQRAYVSMTTSKSECCRCCKASIYSNIISSSISDQFTVQLIQKETNVSYEA